jgi:ribosomal protein S18 acetylase RimI-like enzyme
MEIRLLEPTDEAAVDRFIDRIPEGDRTFFKDDVDDPEVRAAWFRPGSARIFVAVEDASVVGYVVIRQLAGWSSHVGEIRLIVDPGYRGRGIGRELAHRAVLEAVDLGLTKTILEVMADQEPAVAMFRSVGFEPEALLTDHVRDQNGQLHDLMVLAHSVEDSWGSLEAAGIAESV